MQEFGDTISLKSNRGSCVQQLKGKEEVRKLLKIIIQCNQDMKCGAESSRIGVSIIPSPSPSDPIKKLFPSSSDSDENRAVKYNHSNFLGT